MERSAALRNQVINNYGKNIVVAREKPKIGEYFLDQRLTSYNFFEAQITLFLIAYFL